MAIELVGGWFASAIIPNLLDKVTSYVTSNFNLHEATKDSLESLTNTLLTIKATIDVVESHIMMENQSLNEWLRKLKLLSYEADDLIDTFQARTIETTIQAENKVSIFAPSSLHTIKNILLPDEDLKQLEKITKKFEEASRNIGNLVNLINLINKNIVEKQEGIQERRETISVLPGEMELVGRENELGCMFDMILESKEKPESSKMGGASSSNSGGLIVIPIVGLGGVGKTALAQVVYNNQEVMEYFTLKAWVCSSDNFDIKILIEKTIQILSGNIYSNLTSLEYVSKKLIAIIKNMKFLLVLDDVSRKIEDQWDVLYTTLSCGAPRSVVIITTQNKKFAHRVATLSPIVLDTLEWGEFLKLFYHHTFGNTMITEEKREILEQIAISIAEKLHGLPLAAKIIGNLLNFRIDENEWEKVSRSEWWNICEGVDKILPSIGLNYQYLKPWLRQCFAYCSIFPKNYLFQKDRLIQMWIAHNFIQNNNNNNSNNRVTILEEKGREWFDELVENSFFQPAWDNSRYVMHNLMHDLATIISSDECFILSENTIQVPKNVRHLALETNNREAIGKIDEFKQLRSILYFGHCKVAGMYDGINEILSKSKNVRVLDLSHMHMQNRKPPIHIQHLSHLRFLDLSSTGIELLCSSSFEHYHLQTLYLQECKFQQFPRNFNNLINLRHLYASPETIALIHGIGKLTNLQELNEYRIGTTDGHRVTELREMNEISKKLIIFGCENIRSIEEAEQANLMNKKHLSSVEIKWSTVSRTTITDKETLQGLEPHKGIAELMIHNYIVESLPNWVMVMNNFSNLRSFTLYWCTKINSLPSLGHLSFLNILKIEYQHSITYVGDQFYGNTPVVFPSLKELSFFDIVIEEWSDVQTREFGRNLLKVEITACWNLRDVPLLSFGISLKHLRINGTKRFTSLSRHLQSLNSLTVLYLLDCSMKITIDFYNLPLLELLSLRSCPEMQSEGSIQSLLNLRKLEVNNCLHLFSKSISEGLQEQRNKRLRLQEEGLKLLKHLDIDHNLLHQNYDLTQANLASLQFLIYKLFELNQFTIEEDAWFRGLISLKDLTFILCDFEHLPDSLITLPSLKKLTLTSCRNLISLPENGIAPSLRELHILQCSLQFNARCRPVDGADWPKISHLALITIDTKRVAI